VRVWSFGKVRILKNTAKMRANTIGFYALRGKSVHDFLEDSSAESIAGFVEKVRGGKLRIQSRYIDNGQLQIPYQFSSEREGKRTRRIHSLSPSLFPGS
jgi:hypothetical protein